MSPEEAVKALDELSVSDEEAAHGNADAILLAVVPPEVKAAYERVIERADWWACA